MIITFVDTVDTVERDETGLGVTFRGRRGRYDVPEEPSDLGNTLRRAQRTGQPVNVVYDDSSRAVIDVTFA